MFSLCLSTSSYMAPVVSFHLFALCIHSLLRNNFLVPVTQMQPPVFLGGIPAGPGVSPQPGFLLRGVWLPLVATFPTGQSKSN